MASGFNFYEILNTHPNASFNELKCNYKELILLHHPDKSKKVNTNTENADSDTDNPNDDNYTKFVRINEAWNTLKDPEKRKLYDADLMSRKFQHHVNIFEKLTLADMDRTITIVEEDKIDADITEPKNKLKAKKLRTIYTYNCRCGGQYVFDEVVDSSLNQNLCSRTSPEFSVDKELIVECSECSLIIILKSNNYSNNVSEPHLNIVG